MKINKKVISLIITFALILNFSFVCLTCVSAHESILDVDYDNCIWPNYTSQTETKAWYVLVYSNPMRDENSKCYHLSNETQTIKYYFADESPSGYRWDDDISEELAEEIKSSYAESMEKWNNVYFYSYDSNGNIIKNKLINVVEGTSTDNNLVIYPFYENSTIFANAEYNEDDVENIETFASERIEHNHISEWYMNVNLYLFYMHGKVTEDVVNCARNKTGAHEIGHILGLRDLDDWSLCGAGTTDQHHEELLMGYGDNIADRTSDITYKDIAGVAITRGFHTDSDHKWLYAGLDYYGKHKLICSICNGVNAVNSLSGYTYDTYNACGENHTLSSGNMMAVASYGTSDYYKCKYCRYVAPFENIIAQDYDKTYYTDALHKCENDVDGLEYSFYENHTFVDNECTGCGFYHAHSYTPYSYLNNRSHIRYCSCGETQTKGHYVMQSSIVDNRYATCLGCNAELDLRKDFAYSILSTGTRVSINGSYILPNGIVVLVDEDVQAYIEGTLVFYDQNNILEVQ